MDNSPLSRTKAVSNDQPVTGGITSMSKLTTKLAGEPRKILMIIWVVFFLIHLIMVFYLYLDGWIPRESFISAFQQLNTLYAPYVGVITLFYWGGMAKSRGPKRNEFNTAFKLTLLLAVVWNGLIFFKIAPLAILKAGKIETSIDDIKFLGGLFSWLVAPALGYYFARPNQPAD